MQPGITYRPGNIEDTYATFQVFLHAILELSERQGVMAITGGDDPTVLEELWDRRRPLLEHLTHSAEHFWVAERDGEVIGFARSILRPSQALTVSAIQHLELTEFFVLPGEQSRGVGSELLRRAFPDGVKARHRSIIATTDSRALAIYLRTHLYPRFPIINFERPPEVVEMPTDLLCMPLTNVCDPLTTLSLIDDAVIGYHRQEDHTWLMSDRKGYIYFRSGKPVGYGYVGYRDGPFALLDPHDFPAVLAHGETQAALDGHAAFGVETPMINKVAVDYLLDRGFRLSPFTGLFLCDEPFGCFENYLFTAPPFIL